MVRIKFFIELRFEIFASQGDFILNIHAAQTACQSVVSEQFQVTPATEFVPFTDSISGNRYVRMRAEPGILNIRYDATVDIAHHFESPDKVWEVPIAQLPSEALAFIYPSRYCQSDRLRELVNTEFGGIAPGYWRVRAIQDWVHGHTRFVSGSTNATTSAVDTLVEMVGVCRDFAHLMIALCRALNIPARFATGIDYGSDPAFGPTDFHAYIEVFLSGRWYLFDPSGLALPMGLIRLGIGRDAADVSFATIFGNVKSYQPVIGIEGIADKALGILLPHACVDAMSTDGVQLHT